ELLPEPRGGTRGDLCQALLQGWCPVHATRPRRPLGLRRAARWRLGGLRLALFRLDIHVPRVGRLELRGGIIVQHIVRAIVSLIRHLRQIRRVQLLRLFRDILLPKIRRRYQLGWVQRRVCEPLNGLWRGPWRRGLWRRDGQWRHRLRFRNGQRHLLGRILLDSNKSDEAGFVEGEYGRRSPNGDDRAKPDEREAFPSHPFTTPTTAAGTRSASAIGSAFAASRRL